MRKIKKTKAGIPVRGCMERLAKASKATCFIHESFSPKITFNEKKIIIIIKKLARPCGVVTIKDATGSIRNESAMAPTPTMDDAILLNEKYIV